MNKGQTDLARAFVACAKWKPLDGMRGVLLDGPVWASWLTWRDPSGWEDGDGDAIYESYTVLPDLSHELTCAGMLTVLRKASGDPDAYVYPVDETDTAAIQNNGYPGSLAVVRNMMTWGRTELEAILAALRNL